jgi:hypothetical protein
LHQEPKYIFDLSGEQARDTFLKSNADFDMELPKYFDFGPILGAAYEFSKKTSLKKLKGLKPHEEENLNYVLMSNKDGSISWRPFELINPIIYAKCVELITSEENWGLIKQRLDKFSNGVVECCSLPVIDEEAKPNKKEQILNWWKKVEQRSVELSLEFSHCKITDVSNCYPSIYTHSIGWALHGRDFLRQGKNRFDDTFLGNQLDYLIRASRQGQTNGIPQASLLAHVIAELVLGYCDQTINERLHDVQNIKVLRYRDDYRIFGMSDSECDKALKIISEELSKFGMKLGVSKTSDEHNLVVGAVKKTRLVP